MDLGLFNLYLISKPNKEPKRQKNQKNDRMCNVAQIVAVVLLVNAMIRVTDAFFFAKMFGPSAELEAACPGTCQVRFKQKKTLAL